MEQVVTLIAQFGFPIAACVAMAWYVKYVTDKHSKELLDLNIQHKEEMANVTKALENNTLALQKLCDKIGE